MNEDTVTTVGKLRALIGERPDDQRVTAEELSEAIDNEDYRLQNRWDF